MLTLLQVPLAAIAAVLTLAPAVFVVLADRHLQAFRAGIFGAFLRVARLMRVALWLIFAYYVVMVAVAAANGSVVAAVSWPITADGIWLLVRLIGACVAFAAHWLVAAQLHAIVDPEGGIPLFGRPPVAA